MADVRRLPVAEEYGVAVPLDELAREGARCMIAALEVEVEEYVAAFVDACHEDGRRLVVRNGRAKERRVTVGSGRLAIRAPRVDDKRTDPETGERKRFSSKLLPRYARRSPKVSEVLPVLYLRGLSTGDFGPALRDLLGEDASGLSPSSIQRLTEAWQAEHEAFKQRRLEFHRYAHLFVDGVHVSVGLGEDDDLCLLVVIGVREDGTKELLAVEDGYRESTESWASVMRDLKDRGPGEPKLVTGDGALGIWAALKGRLPRRAPPGLLGAQDRERARRAPQAAAGAREGAPARDDGGPLALRRRSGARALPAGVRRQVPEGGREAGQGLGRR